MISSTMSKLHQGLRHPIGARGHGLLVLQTCHTSSLTAWVRTAFLLGRFVGYSCMLLERVWSTPPHPPPNRQSVMDLVKLIPQGVMFKMSIAMSKLFSRDKEWSFGQPLQRYGSQRLYSSLHWWHPISLAIWVSVDPEDRWVHRLHSV